MTELFITIVVVISNPTYIPGYIYNKTLSSKVLRKWYAITMQRCSLAFSTHCPLCALEIMCALSQSSDKNERERGDAHSIRQVKQSQSFL
jgi:hypothetical protein